MSKAQKKIGKAEEIKKDIDQENVQQNKQSLILNKNADSQV